uniref:Uncharacterized protein n=1 Tax=Xiphophorus couchianus TaxID=32473 RepID=A0A3B5MTD9_9TELE
MAELNRQLQEYLTQSKSSGTKSSSTVPGSWFGRWSSPWSGQNSGVTRKQRLLGFGLCAAMSALCFGLSALYAPLLLLYARKFALPVWYRWGPDASRCEARVWTHRVDDALGVTAHKVVLVKWFPLWALRKAAGCSFMPETLFALQENCSALVRVPGSSCSEADGRFAAAFLNVKETFHAAPPPGRTGDGQQRREHRNFLFQKLLKM